MAKSGRYSQTGELAQLAERVLSMHEVAGSIPAFSIMINHFTLGGALVRNNVSIAVKCNGST